MCESGQRHMESMAEEFLELKRLNLFNDKELNLFIKQRKETEDKINGVTKTLAEIQEAIKFEKLFLKKIAQRCRKTKNSDKKKKISYQIINRINSYYEVGCLREPENYEFALAYFEYIKASKKYHNPTHRQLNIMIEKFQSYPDIFEIASKWFQKFDKNDEALNIIHRGIALHPDSKDLYLHAFELELKMDKPNKEESLLPYVRGVFKNIKSFNFIIDLIKILEQQPNTNKIQDEIVSNLLKDYSDEEVIWNLVAQRELNGIPYTGLVKSLPGAANSTENCLERCVKTFEMGISKLPQEKKALLNICLLDTLINVYKQNSKAKLLKTKLIEAQKMKICKLEERHFAVWIDLCEDEQTVLELLKEGTNNLPQSCLLWELFLKFYVLKDNTKEIGDIFEKSIKSLGDRAVTIWEVMIDYYDLRFNEKHTEALYLRAIETKSEKISSIFKPRYLSWIIINKGIQQARDFYNKIARDTPYCKELHKEMSKMEAMECFQPDLGNWRNCLHLMCEQFGDQQVDVWIDYVKFYQENYKGLDANDKIKEIYNQAQSRLSDVLISNFKEKFDALT